MKTQVKKNDLPILSTHLILSKEQVSEKTLNTLTVKNPKYAECERLGFSPVITKKEKHTGKKYYVRIPPILKLYWEIDNKIYLPRGFYTIDEIKAKCDFIDRRVTGNKINIKDTIKLYDYQKEAVDKYVKNKIDIIYAKPGDGKTIMAIKILSKLKVQTIVLINTLVLAEQWKKELLKWTDLNPSDIGTAAEGNTMVKGKVVIGTIQTLLSLWNRAKGPQLERWAKQFGLLILDEVHIHGAAEFQKAGCIFPAKYRLGITASEDRLDNINVQKFHVGKREFYIHRKDRYTPIVYYVRDSSQPPRKGRDMWFDDKKEIYKDYNMRNFDHMCKWIGSRNRRNLLIKHIVDIKMKENRYIAILSHRVAHVNILGELLKEYKPLLFYGDSKAEKRGRLIIATYQKLKLGWNFPRLDTLIIATPIGKRTDIEQACGRIERTGVKDKNNPEIFYVFDNFVRLSQGLKSKSKGVMIRELHFNVIRKTWENNIEEK